jgi:hypothetical protein
MNIEDVFKEYPKEKHLIGLKNPFPHLIRCVYYGGEGRGQQSPEASESEVIKITC